MLPFSSTVIEAARSVRLPLGEVSVAPARTITAPCTTTSPSRFMFEVTLRPFSAHCADAPSQKVVQVSDTAHAVPAGLQVSRLAPLQRLVPALHAPVHRPAEHAFAHVAVARYAVPLELQIST